MSIPAIDLHTHSNHSDGSESPARVVQAAHQAGLWALALTDHDVTTGIPEATAEAERLGIELVPGIELSARFRTEMHILGLFIDPDSPAMRDGMGRVMEVRQRRMEQTSELLGTLGFAITLAEAEAFADGGIVGRAHFAKLMEQRGMVSSVKEAFSKYLGVGKPAFSALQAFSPAEAIQLIREAGGLSFVAHLHQISLPDDELFSLLGELKTHGLDGIEGYYSEYTPDMGRRYRGMAERLGLLLSGGSDYHGTMKPHIRIGTGMGDLAVPYAVLERLKARRG